MDEVEWGVDYVHYDVLSNQGQVKVAVLNWWAQKEEDGFVGSNTGSIDASEQNRVYTLPALEAVPNKTIVQWAQQALGSEQVKDINDGIEDQIAKQKEPVTGGYPPDDGQRPLLNGV